MIRPTQFARASAAVIVIAGALVIGAASSAIARPSHLAPHTPSCASSAIDDWINTSGSGSAGHITYRLRFTNMTTSACVMAGYPGLWAVSLTGRQVGASAVHNGGTVHTVPIASHASVTAMLQVTNTANFTPSACVATLAAGFRVYAPGTTVGRVVPFPVSVCSLTSQVTLAVQPVG